MRRRTPFKHKQLGKLILMKLLTTKNLQQNNEKKTERENKTKFFPNLSFIVSLYDLFLTKRKTKRVTCSIYIHTLYR